LKRSFLLFGEKGSENKKEGGDFADENSNCSLASTIPLFKEGVGKGDLTCSRSLEDGENNVESEVGPEVDREKVEQSGLAIEISRVESRPNKN